MKKLKDIYDPKFIEKFGVKSPLFEEITIEDDINFIDVEEIANHLGIEIEYDILNKSGECENDKIIVNILDADVRQRFTIAHEMGHIFLHELTEAKSRHYDISSYVDSEHRNEEREANNFAANLLMPIKLVLPKIKNYLEENNLGETLDSEEYEMMIESVSGDMFVSKSSLEYRLENIGLVKES